MRTLAASHIISSFNLLPVIVLLVLSEAFAQPTDSTVGKNVMYKCYQSTSGVSERDLSKKSFCLGKMCYTATHLQTKAVRRYCMNNTDDFVKLAPGECQDVKNNIPENTDRMCACSEDFCNGPVANSGRSLKSYIAVFSTNLYKLTLGSSLFVSVVSTFMG
ncbi:hypothetical protein DdX_03554 [Ditylenchus destructor]|uniref:Uncharacterized protein n=1 Tax=Ditylenchus destructor TaxID=166010 RepID=A0AAD4NBV3_9BILA|nr:hypothetical protein DdX_03554 [Ditylenchus destructor]